MEATTKLQRAGRAPATPVNEDHSHEAERYHRRSPGLRHSDSWTTDPRTAPIVLAIVREADCDDPILLLLHRSRTRQFQLPVGASTPPMEMNGGDCSQSPRQAPRKSIPLTQNFGALETCISGDDHSQDRVVTERKQSSGISSLQPFVFQSVMGWSWTKVTLSNAAPAEVQSSEEVRRRSLLAIARTDYHLDFRARPGKSPINRSCA